MSTTDMDPRSASLMEASSELISVSRLVNPDLPDAFRRGQVYSALPHFTGPTDHFECFDLVSEVCAQEGIK